MPGPVPKRSAERRRRNLSGQTDTVRMDGPVEAPECPEHWEPMARDWYLSLVESGQSRYYEPSDWTAALYVGEAMSRNLRSGKFSAELFRTVWAAMTDLLTTEGARRKARMEVERNAAPDLAPVDDLDAYRGIRG